MGENLFNVADLKVGMYIVNSGAYTEWRKDSRCIEIAVEANTTYYLRYGNRSCNFAYILFLKTDGTTEKYSNIGVITTKADTVALRITFADETIIDIANLDYSRFVLSTAPFTDTSPTEGGFLIRGYYPTNSNYIVTKNDAYRCFGIFCQPGHTYKVQNNGADVQVFGLNQYDKTGAYLSRVTSASTTTAEVNAAVIGVVIETANFPDISGIRIIDTTGGGPVDPPEPIRNSHYTKIACKPSTAYHFKYDGAYSAGAVFSYFNGAAFIGQVSGVSIFTTPANCNTVGINLPDDIYTDYSKITLTEGETGEYRTLVQLTQEVEELRQGSGGTSAVPYFDYNFYLFGDSITAPNITRWVPTFLNNIRFKRVENFAVGGANYTCSANVEVDLSGLQQGSSNKIWNQFNRLKKRVDAGEIPAPDVLFILAGINDRYSQIGDPETVFDYTVDYSGIAVTDPLTHNLAGAFRFTLEAIINEYPDVQIIIATPLPVGASTGEKLNSDNATVENITRTLTACAKKMALPVINQSYECGLPPYRETGDHMHYNADGLHPNARGGEKIGKYLARRIANML